MRPLFGIVYRLVLACWIGGMALFTFVLAPVIFRSYPRDAAAEIVGRLFPSYFLFGAGVAVLALALHVMGRGRFLPASRPQLFLLALAVAVSLYVNLVLHPEMQRVKKDVPSFSDMDAHDAARSRFRSLHVQSAVMNLFMIADGVVLFVLALRAGEQPRQGSLRGPL